MVMIMFCEMRHTVGKGAFQQIETRLASKPIAAHSVISEANL